MADILFRNGEGFRGDEKIPDISSIPLTSNRPCAKVMPVRLRTSLVQVNLLIAVDIPSHLPNIGKVILSRRARSKSWRHCLESLAHTLDTACVAYKDGQDRGANTLRIGVSIGEISACIPIWVEVG